jgi:hypothetical protein
MTEVRGYITSPAMSTTLLPALMRAVESVGSAQVGMLGGLVGVEPRCEVPASASDMTWLTILNAVLLVVLLIKG